MRKRSFASVLLFTAIAVLLASGAALGFGFFGNPHPVPVISAYEVALGDLNRDGKTDLVSSQDGLNPGFVYALGKGNGAFQSPQLVPADAIGTEGLALGRFNGDKRLDVALSNYQEDTISLFFGTDGGGFVSGPTLHGDRGTFLLRTGDFNEDGRQDIVACNYTSTATGAISIFLQKRGGGFKAHKSFRGVSSCYGMDVGHLNHDKHLDVVEQGSDGAFSVFLGKGDGTFKSHKDHLSFGENDGYNDITVGDFTGNGHQGVAVASYDLAKVLVYPGNKSGSLGAPKTTTLGSVSPEGIDAGDFNRDGKLDLAMGRYPAGLTVLFGKNNGKFKATPSTAPASNYAYSAAVGRVNKDKAPDIVLGSSVAADVYINSSP